MPRGQVRWEVICVDEEARPATHQSAAFARVLSEGWEPYAVVKMHYEGYTTNRHYLRRERA